MLKFVFEPHFTDIFHKFKSDITATVPAGRFVKKVDESTVDVSDGEDVYGLLSQDVYIHPGPEYQFIVNDHRAYAGNQVGLYVSAGVFWTDQFVGEPAPGATLYVTSEGKVSDTYAATATTSAGSVPVGKVVKVEGGLLLFVYQPATFAPSGD